MTSKQVRYERVRVAPEDGAPFTVLLEIVDDAAGPLLVGYEVDGEGIRIEPPGADERLRAIDKMLVRRRTPLRVNRIYGTLEVAS